MSKCAARTRTGHDRAILYDEIADKIAAELEAGHVPWVRPWGTAANAVRFGMMNDDVLVAGEGIETMLSLRWVLPSMPMAALSANNH